MYYDLECFEGDKKNYIHAYANRIDQIQQYIVWEGHFTVKGKIPLRQLIICLRELVHYGLETGDILYGSVVKKDHKSYTEILQLGVIFSAIGYYRVKENEKYIIYRLVKKRCDYGRWWPPS